MNRLAISRFIRSCSRMPVYYPDPRQYPRVLPVLPAASTASLSEAIDNVSTSSSKSIDSVRFDSALQNARLPDTGVQVWDYNNESNMGNNQASSDNRQTPPRSIYTTYNHNSAALGLRQCWPQQHYYGPPDGYAGRRSTDAPRLEYLFNDLDNVFEPEKLIFDAGSTSCDQSYATNGAFNELLKTLGTSSNEQSSYHPRVSTSRSGENAVPWLHGQRPKRTFDDTHTMMDSIMMEHLNQFSADVDSTDDGINNTQRPLLVPQIPANVFLLGLEEGSSGIDALGLTVDENPYHRPSHTPLSSSKMSDVGVPNQKLPSSIAAPSLTPTDSRTATSSSTSHRSGHTSNPVTCPDCGDHPGFTGKDQMNNYRRHRREQHSEQAKERFVCCICSQSTIRRGRRRHLEKEHQMSLPPNPQRRPPWGELKDILDGKFVKVESS